MRAEREENQIAIHLTQKEVEVIIAGRTVGDRPGVTMPDAKVEVLPLSAIEKDDSVGDRYSADRLERARAAALRGILFPNGDLQVIVPAVKLIDVRVAEARLPREGLETPLTKQGSELVNHVIPEKGVVVYFGGSLQVLDVDNFFYR